MKEQLKDSIISLQLSVLIDNCKDINYGELMSKHETALILSHRGTRGDKTRSRIVEAAINEYKFFGVEKANIGKIARQAGVSRPTFYFHFPTKEHVLLELQRSLELPLIILIKDSDNLDSMFKAFVRGLIKARQKVGSNRLFNDMILIYTKQAQNELSDDQPMMEAIYHIFKSAKQKGELRKHLEPIQATLLFLTSVFGYLIGQGNAASDEDCAEALLTLSRLFLDS